jgi:hypothetical protein
MKAKQQYIQGDWERSHTERNNFSLPGHVPILALKSLFLGNSSVLHKQDSWSP